MFMYMCSHPLQYTIRQLVLLIGCTVITCLYLIRKKLSSHLLYTNIDQTPLNSLHGLLNCEIGE